MIGSFGITYFQLSDAVPEWFVEMRRRVIAIFKPLRHPEVGARWRLLGYFKSTIERKLVK
jgi:hypothetical protein